jgi:4-diphosphocytidyl-2C-methyl-D-erythritol kinase
VYGLFDARNGADGFAVRRAALLDALADVREARDLARLPVNDLASSPLCDRLRRLGAFRADVSGAGPCVYGLFSRRAAAEDAAQALGGLGTTWVTTPV